MKKNTCIFIAVLAMVFSLVLSVAAQETKVVKKTEVTQNPDGTYTVIEYPVGKEVLVDLTPVTTVTSKGMAKVIRAADGTKVIFDLNTIPADATNMYAYAVDPAGLPTLLGPITVANGIAKAEFTTPMNQFMLVLSPTEGLTAIDPTTPIYYRSALPTGYAIVPKRVSETRTVAVAPAVVSREPTAAVVAPAVVSKETTTTTTTAVAPGVVSKETTTTTTYDVPLLNVSTFGEAEREVKLKFDGELSGLEAKAYIDREKGVTKVRMHFDDMKKVPANKRFTLWTYSPDGKYTKLGHVINSGKRDEAAIRSETTLADFGLFITAEDEDVTIPTSRIYSVFTYTPPAG